MLSRLTVSTLLQAIIAVLSTCVVIALTANVLESWGRLGSASHASVVAEASGFAFVAMHNLRTDRVSTGLALNADSVLDPEVEKSLPSYRDAENAALRSVIGLTETIEIGDRERIVSTLKRLTARLSVLQSDSWAAMRMPKSSRQPELAKEYSDVSSTLLESLEKLGSELAVAVHHRDPLVDQLLLVKQTAWTLRNSGGQAVALVSGGINSGRLPPEAAETYAKYTRANEAAWVALETVAEGLTLRSVTDALASTKAAYFDPQYLALRERLLKSLISSEKPEISATEWSFIAIKRLTSAVAVAERALEEAQIHTRVLRVGATRSLLLQLLLLVCAVVIAVVAMVTVSRHIVSPLHLIRDDMLKVANGDLAVEIGYVHRGDEIGALARALRVFKQNAEEKLTIERQTLEASSRMSSRQKAIDSYMHEFELQVAETLQLLSDASVEMKTTSDGLSMVSSQTKARAEIAAVASEEASANVQSVASASAQLNASINDVSRQAAHATAIAGRAVGRAMEADGTIQGLANTANRIGEVVGLINDIASQTNLLALNATIEAARAGDAGRGFAVVASEVKSLASQTAKATEDISEQIADVQKVAHEAVQAIQSITDIIGEVNEVATAIAAAIEEQGAATQEITRSTEQAAEGTRDVSENISGVSVDAVATGTAAVDVSRASNSLGTQSQTLSGQVTTFLSKLRAA